MSGRDSDDEPELDSEDEEIVFIGRNGKMSDVVREERERAEMFLQREKMIWEGAADDRGSGFGYVILLLFCLMSWKANSE